MRIGIGRANRKRVFESYAQGVRPAELFEYRHVVDHVHKERWLYFVPDDGDKLWSSLKEALFEIREACFDIGAGLSNYIEDYPALWRAAVGEANSATANYYGADLGLAVSSNREGRFPLTLERLLHVAWFEVYKQRSLKEVIRRFA